MSSSFVSNISSLRAQRQLTRTTDALQRSYERLSTGLRIVRASDDAAGLAIASTLETNARLYTQASRNINDGLSMLNIADGTLEQQSNILMRLTELAEQSSSGSLAAVQRLILNREYQALVDEFGRLGDSTAFNGRKLLRGLHSDGTSELKLQTGIDGSTSSQISLALGDSGSLSGVLRYDIAGNTATVAAGSYQEIADDYQNRILTVNLTDAQGRAHEALIGVSGEGFDDLTISFQIFVKAGEFGYTTAPTPDTWVSVGGGPFANSVALVDDVTTGFRKATVASTTILLDEHPGISGQLTLDISALRFSFSGKLTPGYGGAADNTTTDQALVTALDFTGVETTSRAQTAITVLRNRLNSLSKSRGEIGALQSRLETAYSVTSSSQVLTQGAASRIRDVDIAEESARLVSLNILQQASSAILSNANQQPALLLSLLSRL